MTLEATLKAAPKVRTWIQVLAVIIAAFVQIFQISVNPQAQLLGTMSLAILGTLAGAIIYSDYMRHRDQANIRMRKEEAMIRIRELKSYTDGAIGALKEAEVTFRRSRGISRARREQMERAADLVEGQRRLLERRFREAQRQT
jgi:hypothetical protein